MPEQIVQSESINQKRWKKFKSIKRGYYSFILIIGLYILSFLLPLFVSSKALVVKYEGNFYFPALSSIIPGMQDYYDGTMFDQEYPGDANFRQLQKKWADSNNWVIMPIYPFNPFEDITNNENKMYDPPSMTHWFGTDNTGRDVFARMCYAFNISISFALILTILNYTIGISVGGAMGYYGGKFDLCFQRLIEIWSSLPLLFVVIIMSSILTPSFFLLIFIYTLVNWIGLTYYMRAEFYREKSKDYVSAAISMGQSDARIIFKHILPNSLVPVITYFPFALVAGISVLVSLDFLGFGLPPPTPSWGQILYVGISNISKWWMVFAPVMAQFFTLLCIVFIGEAVREAFDPKIYSRLR